MQSVPFWQNRLVELGRDLDALEAGVAELRERHGCSTIMGGTNAELAEIAALIETADGQIDQIRRLLARVHQCTVAAVGVARQAPMAGMRNSIPLLTPVGF